MHFAHIHVYAPKFLKVEEIDAYNFKISESLLSGIYHEKMKYFLY